MEHSRVFTFATIVFFTSGKVYQRLASPTDDGDEGADFCRSTLCVSKDGDNAAQAIFR